MTVRIPFPAAAARFLRHEWRRSWSRRASRAESASVLRIIAASVTAGVPVAPLLDAWAEDSRSGQGLRLEKAASLMRQGATASDAATRVPGLIHDDHAVALAFGERSGLLSPVVRVNLAGDELLDPSIRRTIRLSIGYLSVVFVIFVMVAAYLVIKINPMLIRIAEEYDTGRPPAFTRWQWLMHAAVSLWWIPVSLAAVVAVLRLSPPAWQVVTRPWNRSRRTTAALDALATAEACGLSAQEAATTLAACQTDPVIAARLRASTEPGPAGTALARAGLIDPVEADAIDNAGADAPAALLRLASARRGAARRRLSAIGEAIVPLVAIVMGVIVLWQSLAVFTFLSDLIEHLS